MDTPSQNPPGGAEVSAQVRPRALHTNVRTGVRMRVMDSGTCELLGLDLRRAEALRRSRPPVGELVSAAEGAKALADPTRLAVAIALRDGGELCVCDLAWVCERSDKLASHHARVLRGAGLVQSRREHKMVLYALTDRGRELLGAVLGADAAAIA